MTDNALIVSSNGNGIAQYAPREDVRELTNRLLAMHPAAAEVGENAMRAAAQLALMLGANPLPGVNEMHIWRDNKGRNCMSLGINYWRRKAEEWGGVLYEIRPRLMKTAEAVEYGVPNGTTGAICKAVRANDMIRYRQLGFAATEVWDMCGRTGVGTATANEYAKAGRPPSWTALKRAETDMLRQLFPAEFGRVDREMITTDASVVIAPDGDVIEGNVTEDEPQPRYTLADANTDLFGNGAAHRAATAGEDAPEDGEYEDGDAPAEVSPFEQFLAHAVDLPAVQAVPWSKPGRLADLLRYITDGSYEPSQAVALEVALNIYCGNVADNDGNHTKAAAEKARVLFQERRNSYQATEAEQDDLFGDAEHLDRKAATQAALATAQGNL